MANVALTENVAEKDMTLEIGENKETPKIASQLPEAKGFKLLIALPEIDEMTDGGIIKSEGSRHEESIASFFVHLAAPESKFMAKNFV